MINFANFLSVLSLACGFTSIIFSLESQFTFSAWAILVSVVFDGLDGQAARLSNNPTEFGKELDSLVDVVSFGVAPAILGYVYLYHDFYSFAFFVLLFYLLCSIFRLAKYNITPKGEMSDCFYGLPTTVSGGMISAFILLLRKFMEFPSRKLFLVLVISLSLLMVSKIRYPNLDVIKQLVKKNIIGFIIFVLAALFILKAPLFIFTLFVLYITVSPFLVKKA